MKIAHIVPTNYLKKFYRTNYHLILAHRVLIDKEYCDFYKRCSENGDTVLNDNGAFEKGRSASIDDILKATFLTKSKVVCCPDTLYNKDETIKLTLDFLVELNSRYYRRVIPYKPKTLAIPQAVNKLDWLECYYMFLKNKDIDIIGISFISLEHVFPEISQTLRRIYVLDMLKNENLLKKPIHLLGIADNPIELKIIKSLSLDKCIEGVDSSTAFVHGMNGYRFDKVTGLQILKIKEKLDFDIKNLTWKQIKNIKYNMKIMENWIK